MNTISQNTEGLPLVAYGIDDVDKRIIEAVNGEQGQSQSQLARTLGINRPTLRYRILNLALDGFLKLEKCRGCVKIYSVEGVTHDRE